MSTTSTSVDLRDELLQSRSSLNDSHTRPAVSITELKHQLEMQDTLHKQNLQTLVQVILAIQHTQKEFEEVVARDFQTIQQHIGLFKAEQEQRSEIEDHSVSRSSSSVGSQILHEVVQTSPEVEVVLPKTATASEHIAKPTPQSSRGSTSDKMSHDVVAIQDEYNNRLHIRKISNPSNEKATRALSAEAMLNTSTEWRPHGVAKMPSISLQIPSNHDKTFSFDLIKQVLHGEEYYPGFYFDAPTIPHKAYWLLEADHEPFLPPSPGTHGAKLTSFFNSTPNTHNRIPDDINYINIPVFVRDPTSTEYTYFGHYAQHRFSDRTSHHELMNHIPTSVLAHHATQLAAKGRPAWVTEALRDHFWPRPTYTGPIAPPSSTPNAPSTTIATTPTSATSVCHPRVKDPAHAAFEEYMAELRHWHAETDLKLSFLTADAILKSFGNADAALEPGMRLWWEYLECVGYDEGFYEMLVGFQQDERAAAVLGSRVVEAVVNGMAKVKKGEDEGKDASRIEGRDSAKAILEKGVFILERGEDGIVLKTKVNGGVGGEVQPSEAEVSEMKERADEEEKDGFWKDVAEVEKKMVNDLTEPGRQQKISSEWAGEKKTSINEAAAMLSEAVAANARQASSTKTRDLLDLFNKHTNDGAHKVKELVNKPESIKANPPKKKALPPHVMKAGPTKVATRD